MTAQPINLPLLIEHGLVSLPTPAIPPPRILPPPKPPRVLRPKRPVADNIIPLWRTKKAPPRERLSLNEARMNCICIHCRVAPAKYYGPVGGYAVGCEECLGRIAATRRAHAL